MTTSIPNIITIICLIIIVLLVYIRTKKVELYDSYPTATLSLINNDTLQNSYLLTFLNKYINRQNNQNKYKLELNQRQNTINDLSKRVSSLINPSGI